ncbi:MAG: hypothetical protein RBR81_11585 [Bacteroidales bacterium]|jgi:hypothetical protein|nr:hypothetical protein [Bacteroidales bacterium]
MDSYDKQKIEQIARLRKTANSFFSKESNVFRSFSEMEKLTFIDGAMTKKNK